MMVIIFKVKKEYMNICNSNIGIRNDEELL